MNLNHLSTPTKKDDSPEESDEKRNIKGSTNNLADFDENDDLAEKIEQITINPSQPDFTPDEQTIPDYLDHVDQMEKPDFQTEKLLKITHDSSIRVLVKVNYFLSKF